MSDENKVNSEEMGTAHKEEFPEREVPSPNQAPSPLKQAPEKEPPSSKEASQEEPSEEEKKAQMEKDYLYLRAEMENMKRQNIKERSQLLKYGGERLARDLLETLDVFDSVLKSEVNSENFQSFVDGLQMTAQSLKETLKKHGITSIDCVGKPFDPKTQEALSNESSEEHPEGHVTQVFKVPYQYHDKLLRAGQVVVSQGKPE